METTTQKPKAVKTVAGWAISSKDRVEHFETANEMLKAVKAIIIEMHETGQQWRPITLTQEFKWVEAK